MDLRNIHPKLTGFVDIFATLAVDVFIFSAVVADDGLEEAGQGRFPNLFHRHDGQQSLFLVLPLRRVAHDEDDIPLGFLQRVGSLKNCMGWKLVFHKMAKYSRFERIFTFFMKLYMPSNCQVSKYMKTGVKHIVNMRF